MFGRGYYNGGYNGGRRRVGCLGVCVRAFAVMFVIAFAAVIWTAATDSYDTTSTTETTSEETSGSDVVNNLEEPEDESTAEEAEPSKEEKEASKEATKKEPVKKKKRNKAEIQKLYDRMAMDAGCDIKYKDAQVVNAYVERIYSMPEFDSLNAKYGARDIFTKTQMQALILYLNGGRHEKIKRDGYNTIGICQWSPSTIGTFLSTLGLFNPDITESSLRRDIKDSWWNVFYAVYLFNDLKSLYSMGSDQTYAMIVLNTLYNDDVMRQMNADDLEPQDDIRDIEKCVKKLYKYEIGLGGFGKNKEWEQRGV